MAEITNTSQLDHTRGGARTNGKAAAGVGAVDQQDPLAQVLEWDWGTAYEMLFSLHTILRPKEHGIPAPWAAGVRKRLSPQSQADLKTFFSMPFGYLAYSPLHIVLEMERPKNVKSFLDMVERTPDEEFTHRIHLPIVGDESLKRLMDKAALGKRMTDVDVEEYRRIIAKSAGRGAPTAAEIRKLFTEMGDSAGTKRRWLSLLREYQTVYFAEEERRVGPVLEQMVADAQKLAKKTTVPDLIERLSNGFTLSQDFELTRLVLVPSVWNHPFVVRFEPADNEFFVAWGAHPPGYKLVPGETVPDDALLVLRALGDPTRLRLLRLLSVEPRSPQSLAIELKLSLPTVSHHMRELRIAGLIRIEVAGKGRESKYTVRWPSARRAFEQLEEFVLRGEKE
jgi:DNA-binding transcriptional ArsR family regulator